MTDALSEIARGEREMNDWLRCLICGGRYLNERQLALHIPKHSVEDLTSFALAMSIDNISIDSAKIMLMPTGTLKSSGDNK